MRFVAAAVLLGIVAAPAVQAQAKKPAEVSFAKQVLPILKASCLKCHDAKNKKGGFDLSTYDAIKKGGKGGSAFAAGEPDKSPLVTSISGDKPEMPKKATPLTKAQVELIARWVKEGAKNN